MPTEAWTKTKEHAGAKRGVLHSLAVQFFIVTAVLMVGALILMSFALSSLKASQMQSETAEDTLLEITTIESRLIDSNLELNGYVISQDPWYARRMASDRRDIEGAMVMLAQSVRDDPEPFALYNAIAARLFKWQNVYDTLARPEHRGEVANVAHSPLAQAERGMNDELRARLWDLLRAERAKRYAEHTAMTHEAAKSFWIAVGIVILSMLTGAASLMLAKLGRTGQK